MIACVYTMASACQCRSQAAAVVTGEQCQQHWLRPISTPQLQMSGMMLVPACRVQCSICRVWRIVAFEAVAALRDGDDWTCALQRCGPVPVPPLHTVLGQPGVMWPQTVDHRPWTLKLQRETHGHARRALHLCCRWLAVH